MIPSVTKGGDPGGLCQYLAGPGHKHEHRLQRTIDTNMGLVPVGPLSVDGATAIADELRSLQHMFRQGDEWATWQCSLSLAAAEGVPTDAEWSEMSREFLTEMGFIDPALPDPRWAVVGHGPSAEGNEHVHLVVSRWRTDGSKLDTNRDWPRSQQAARVVAAKHGLAAVAGQQRGAVIPRAVQRVATVTDLVPRLGPTELARSARELTDSLRTMARTELTPGPITAAAREAGRAVNAARSSRNPQVRISTRASGLDVRSALRSLSRCSAEQAAIVAALLLAWKAVQEALWWISPAVDEMPTGKSFQFASPADPAAELATNVGNSEVSMPDPRTWASANDPLTEAQRHRLHRYGSTDAELVDVRKWSAALALNKLGPVDMGDPRTFPNAWVELTDVQRAALEDEGVDGAVLDRLTKGEASWVLDRLAPTPAPRRTHRPTTMLPLPTHAASRSHRL